MIRKFNEHITGSLCDDILSDLKTQEIRSDIFADSSSNISTYIVTVNNTIIVSDHIKEYLFKGSVNEKYFLSIGGLRIKEITDIKKQIFYELRRLNVAYNIFIKTVINLTTFGSYDRHIKLTNEYKERIEEFDIIKNNNIDYISLNNLFDFYSIEFNEHEFKKIYKSELNELKK